MLLKIKQVLQALIAIILAFSAFQSANLPANLQSINGIVTAIDSEYITIATEDGNGWAIYYENGYVVGDNVTIIFDTLGTDDIYDDIIIDIQIM